MNPRDWKITDRERLLARSPAPSWWTSVSLTEYTGTLRQPLIRDLGHDEPTILLTSDRPSTLKALTTRYAQRMLIEKRVGGQRRLLALYEAGWPVKSPLDPSPSI